LAEVSKNYITNARILLDNFDGVILWIFYSPVPRVNFIHREKRKRFAFSGAIN